MTWTKNLVSMLSLAACILLAFPAFAKSPVQQGDNLAGVELPAPCTDQARLFLGVEEKEPFTMDQLERPFALIKIVGVYCPICHQQAPEINRLYNRIQEDENLADKICMFAISPGATPAEVEHLQSSWRPPYPILADQDYLFHKAVGEPDTPFTIIVDNNGDVHYAELGRIPGMKEMMETIEKIIR